MRLVNLAGFPVDDTIQRIANPVDKELLARLTFLWKNNLFPGFLLPRLVFGAETAVTVTIRIYGTVFLLPDVAQIYTAT